MSSDLAIAARSLTKHYPHVTAVQGLDLTVRRGEIYGFLGLNGAGKTTTIRMVLGLIRPSAGSVEVLGEPVRPGHSAFLGRVGCLIEAATAYPNLTVHENLEIHRRLTRSPLSAVDEAIERLRLEDYRERRAGQLSLGNKQRLALARALLHHPDLLVLDEPANSLDPAGIVEIRELLRALARERGTTVFMSSHILTEVTHLADRIGIVHRGRLLEELDRDDLRSKRRALLEILTTAPDDARDALAPFGFTIESTDSGISVTAEPETVPAVAHALLQAGVTFTGISPRAEDLEEYFLRLTGGDA
jgi:ABC-type multidrug transport system ATPase subunit